MRFPVPFFALVVVLAVNAVAENPAPVPIAKGEKTTTISQYGVTWTFASPVLAGRFITGDWWVVGPVEIKSVSPAPVDGLNGSVVNPKAGDKHGYDKRVVGFDAGMRCAFPLHLKAGQSLVSTESLEKLGVPPPEAVFPKSHQECALRTAVVLTCLETPPPQDAFRPAYVGEWKEMFRVGNLHRELLPNLNPPKDTPKLAEMERMFERIWLDHKAGYTSGFIHPLANMPDYGREITTAVSAAAMILLLADPEKKHDTLLLRFIQKGIDNYGVVRSNNKIWTADGGHDSGRKWPILFAGLMLGHDGMMHVKAAFAEDEQTYYGKGFNGQTALWTIRPEHISARHEECDPAKWLTFGQGPNNGKKAEGYRKLNGPTWIGQALAARVMGAMDLWDHPVYFDYVDRWYKEEGKAAGSPFSMGMWDAYRSKADAMGTEAKKHRPAGK